MQKARWLMDQPSILSEEIKSWERFEYTLREENRLLFKQNNAFILLINLIAMSMLGSVTIHI